MLPHSPSPRTPISPSSSLTPADPSEMTEWGEHSDGWAGHLVTTGSAARVTVSSAAQQAVWGARPPSSGAECFPPREIFAKLGLDAVVPSGLSRACVLLLSGKWGAQASRQNWGCVSSSQPSIPLTCSSISFLQGTALLLEFCSARLTPAG